ncbi:serine/threonine protein kinase [Geodermatophilus tzadiensis]|uniref:non-specific serine/threonine protein kinase n=1 Tax=Geodermatophilus tzadiensis TaxID=1137988 RepID=A0A2T0TSR8_9ACTN|nr:serine/threonine-protein kinase [Geodermatophilus tzadiensis]PRY48697.1 serine/threonine protein kinase [Geodermatophilus tzadiensis]
MNPETFGPYELLELLGRGGMGEVHRAWDTRRGRVVALKRLLPELADDEQFRARFYRECNGAARLNEAHVVPIHDFGEIDGRLYLDMRLVDGRDLSELLEQEGPFPADLAVTVVEQVAAALDAAHAAGIVHRDVKPSNVLVTGTGTVPHCYLVDFGIAGTTGGRTTGSLTRTGMFVGTLEYVAPERLGDGPTDHRVDVYSLACLLHQLLIGQPPFPTSEPAALCAAHLYREPPRPSETVPSLPRALDTVIARGMAKDPEARYPSAGALAWAARAALGDDHVRTPVGPVGGAPPTTTPPPPARPPLTPPPPVPPAASTTGGYGAAAFPPPPPTLVPAARSEGGLPPTATGTASPPPDGPRAARRPAGTRPARRRLTAALVALAVAAAAAGGVVAAQLLGEGTAVATEAIDDPGDHPFHVPTPEAGGQMGEQAPPPDPPSTAPPEGVYGDQPGLYGGTGAEVCDKAALTEFLETHPSEAAAWADAQDIAPTEIGAYIDRLTPVVLRFDTAVTNHGFEGGRATPFQSVLQAGTAVLVDEYGSPQVRCACGNPLDPPAPRPSPEYEDAAWPAFSDDVVVEVTPAVVVVEVLVVVEIDGQIVERPRGTTGEADRAPDPKTLEEAQDFVEDPTTATPPPATTSPAGTAPTTTSPTTTSPTTRPTTTHPTTAATTTATTTTTAPTTTTPAPTTTNPATTAPTTTARTTTTAPTTTSPTTTAPTTSPTTTTAPTTTSPTTTAPTTTPPSTSAGPSTDDASEGPTGGSPDTTTGDAEEPPDDGAPPAGGEQPPVDTGPADGEPGA